MFIAYSIISTYCVILLMLIVYCLHRIHIMYLYAKHRTMSTHYQDLSSRRPRVTVQLPIYNEMYVVERLLNAAAALSYPRHLLEIQVLDDSTDETSLVAQKHVRAMQQKGLTVSYINRNKRSGFKAGALQHGMAMAQGELIAVFDADFIPHRNFLNDTVAFFSDTTVGMVQTRWGHINRDYSLLTRLQALFLDAHFILEHTARNRSGRFFNFNGTAGIWRKSCIESSGGWQFDTLTEDLDLSYRAQLKGWKCVFLPELITPGEIPVDINSFKSQQHRWAKGSIETACKLIQPIVRSSVPFRVKLEACFHLTSNMNYLFVIALSMCAYPALVTRISLGWHTLFWFDLICFIVSIIPICGYYITADRKTGHSIYHTILLLPFLLALGIGLSVNNGRAVCEALLRYKTSFSRTPKFNISQKIDSWKHKKYRPKTADLQTAVEIFFGLYFISAISYALQYNVYTAIPFLSLFACGFLFIGITSLFDSRITRLRCCLKG